MGDERPNGPLKLLVVVAGVLIASALLAPLLHDVLPYRFDRIFRRLVMIGAILGVVGLVRFRKGTFVRYGLAWTGDSARHLRIGFALGFFGLLVFVPVSFVWGHAGIAVRELTALRWVQKIAGAAATGVLVGLTEEFVLRGVVFGYLRDSVFRGRVLAAMITTSLVYAALHFVDFRMSPVSPDPGIADSLRLILAPVRALAEGQTMWPAAVGLFLFGMVLNACVVRTGSLYPSIGLHAGSVTVLRIIWFFVGFGPAGSWVWGTKKVYDGAVGWTILLLIGVAAMGVLGRTRSAPQRR